MGIIVNRPASKIPAIKNFIIPEECNAVREAVVPDLRNAKVANGRGGYEVSKYPKAKQAAIEVEWELEAAGNPIARLARCVYD